MKVFITGGGGLIGQAVAERHLKSGHQVAIWDTHINKFNDYRHIVGKQYPAPMTSLYEALADFQPDVISHHAALVSVGDSQLHPGLYHQNNTGVTADLIQAIINGYCRPKLIIHAGSMGPYGEGFRNCHRCGYGWYMDAPRTTLQVPCPSCKYTGNDVRPMAEDDELHPVSQYGASKRAQEEMLRLFAYAYDVPVVSLRYFSVYGTRCNPNNPYTGVLSIIGHKLLNEDAVVLNEDGKQTRDLVHAEDCADAHMKVAMLTKYEPFQAFNVGTGESYSLQRVAILMRNALNSDKPIQFNGKVRIGDVQRCRAYNDMLVKATGWAPQHKLEDDITTYCNWLNEHKTEFFGSQNCTLADAALDQKGLFK